MLMCFVRSLVDRPFLAILIADMLSSLKNPGAFPIPASCMKFFRYMPSEALSDSVTSSASQDDFVTKLAMFFSILNC